MHQLALALSPQHDASFENFVPGRNAEALATLRALASGGGGERFVYLWGAPGSGRGHLLRAVVRAARAAGRGAVLVQPSGGCAALDEARSDAVLSLAKVERLDPGAQESLFGAFNRIRDGRGALVASGDCAPAGLPLRPDLATRLAWGLVYEVHALSDEEKLQAMAERAAALGFDLPAEAQLYVLRHGRRDLASLLRVIDLLDLRSLEAQRMVTLPLVREVLRTLDGPGSGEQLGCDGPV